MLIHIMFEMPCEIRGSENVYLLSATGSSS